MLAHVATQETALGNAQDAFVCGWTLRRSLAIWFPHQRDAG